MGRDRPIYRHRWWVRLTHWINLVSMTALLMSGLQIFNAHPALFPRDLQVQIPSGGTTFSGKLNEAYSVGGPNLLLTILKTQVFAGQNFHVNHVIDVNF